MKNRVLVLLFLFVLAGCGFNKQDVTIKNVERVLMQSAKEYVLLVKVDGSSELAVREVYADSPEHVKLIMDVPKGQFMWARSIDPDDMNDTRLLEIHIHTLDDIEGGGWDHGKHGSGQTHVIE